MPLERTTVSQDSLVPAGFSFQELTQGGGIALAPPQMTFRYEPRFLELANEFLAPRPSGESFSIGFCPVKAGESVGRFVSLFAASMSQLAASPVLLVDATFRLPGLASYVGAAATPGLCEMIAPLPLNRFDCIHTTRHPNLHILPGGTWTGKNPPRFEDRLEWLYALVSKHFQNVIFALPAWGEVPAFEPAYALADAMLLTVRPDADGAQAVRKAVRNLKGAKARLVGSVLSEMES